MNNLKVAIFFGGRSTEHEVSVITGIQAYHQLDKEKYEVTPVYVSKDGAFYTDPRFLDMRNYKDLPNLLLSATPVTLTQKNNQAGLMTSGFFGKFLPIDVAFPMFHGSFGEDGCIQGLFETYQVPYVGFNVLGAAIGMDKTASKRLYTSLGMPIGNYVEIKRHAWNKNLEACMKHIDKTLKNPYFVKPGTIGSSIGVNKATDTDSLTFAIEVAFTYAEKVLVEEMFTDTIEINCAAIGYADDVQVSLCEMPKPKGDLLSYEDKYQRGEKGKMGKKDAGTKSSGMASLSREIPASISEKLTKKIQDTTVEIFKAMDGCGVARVDYFVDKKNDMFWVNEINTLPGSFAFYLFPDMPFPKMMDRLIEYALQRATEQKKTQYTFDSPLLTQLAIASEQGER